MVRKYRNLLTLAAVSAVFGAAAMPSAKAALIIDIVATTLNGSPLSGTDDAHNVTVANVGDIIGYNVVANITGGTAQTDSLAQVNGDLISTGTLLGNMTNANSASFSGTGFSNGTLLDRDADTDIDVGGVLNPVNTGRPVNTTSGIIVYIAPTGSPVLGNSLLLGSGTFTVTGATGASNLHFVLGSTTTTNKAPSWTENSAAANQSTGTAQTGIGINVTFASVPEPASMGVLALGATALLARRRGRKSA